MERLPEEEIAACIVHIESWTLTSLGLNSWPAALYLVRVIAAHHSQQVNMIWWREASAAGGRWKDKLCKSHLFFLLEA
jgi:predicted Rossmann fold nucleotide-binding protein DprA/Smf involved in DNA uptake